ncbi:MAG: glycosyl hydrolase [Bacteroidota bacterium]
MRTKTLFALLGSLFYSVLPAQQSAAFGAPKFAPADGQKLLIIGQDLSAVGGLDTYQDGYYDHFPELPSPDPHRETLSSQGSRISASLRPAGVTTYTSIPSLAGLNSAANWGAGTVNAQAYLDNDRFRHSCLSIGLYLVGQLKKIGRGKHDDAIIRLAEWIKQSQRPVFLRIGYEFEGEWNDYQPKHFIKAWQRIVQIFDQQKVDNVAYVWQSAGINLPNIEDWYPGDEYVNWVGYSHFDGPNPGQRMRAFAEDHDKPIMIAEATPKVDLKEVDGTSCWEQWFAPLFELIYQNDRIKALAYISTYWDQQPMWAGQGWGDSRLHINEPIRQAWTQEMQKPYWLAGGEQLFQLLGYQSD